MRVRLQELRGSVQTGTRTRAQLSVSAPNAPLANQAPAAPVDLDVGALAGPVARYAGLKRDATDKDVAAFAQQVARYQSEQEEATGGPVSFDDALKAVMAEGQTPKRVASRIAGMNWENMADSPVFRVSFEQTKAEFDLEMYRRAAEANLTQFIEGLDNVPLEQQEQKIGEALQAIQETYGSHLEGHGFYGRSYINSNLLDVHRSLVDRGMRMYKDRIVDEQGQKMRILAASAAIQLTGDENETLEKETYNRFNELISRATLSMGAPAARQIAADGILAAAADVEANLGAGAAAEFLEDFSQNVKGRGQDEASILHNTPEEDLITREISSLRYREQTEHARKNQAAALARTASENEIRGLDMYGEAFAAGNSTDALQIVDDVRQGYSRAADKKAYLESLGYEGEPGMFLSGLASVREEIQRATTQYDAAAQASFKRYAVEAVQMQGPYVEGSLAEHLRTKALQDPNLNGERYEEVVKWSQRLLQMEQTAPRAFQAVLSTDTIARTVQQAALSMMPEDISPLDRDVYERELNRQQAIARQAFNSELATFLSEASPDTTVEDALLWHQNTLDKIVKTYGGQGVLPTTAETLAEQSRQEREERESRKATSAVDSLYDPQARQQSQTLFGGAVLRDSIEGSFWSWDLFKLEDQITSNSLHRQGGTFGGLDLANSYTDALDGVTELTKSAKANVLGYSFSLSGLISSDQFLRAVKKSRTADGALGEEDAREIAGDDESVFVGLERALRTGEKFGVGTLNPYATRFKDFKETRGWIIPDPKSDPSQTPGIAPGIAQDTQELETVLNREIVPESTIERIDRILNLFDIPVTEENRVLFVDMQKLNWSR